MGPYCRYCGHRCFVLRILPHDATSWPGKSLLMATCKKGMDHSGVATGYTYQTAINPNDKREN